jgi:hypothetical protein
MVCSRTSPLCLLTMPVYGNEEGCPMRKGVNWREYVKAAKIGIRTPSQKTLIHRIALGMDARKAETDAGSACDSPARRYAGNAQT